MSREEIQKLLGGYATDTLSEAEQCALFGAALEDQELFDALAKEQALRDVLQEPVARQQVLDALGPARAPARLGFWRWMRRPAVLAVAGGFAILLVAAGLILRRTGTPAPREYDVAQVRAPSPPAFPTEALRQKPLRQELKEQKVLPALPVVRLRPSPPAASIGRLARSLAEPAEVAGRLYSQPNIEAPSFAMNVLPQSRAKLARTSAGAPTASNLGVRYSLLRKGADGEYAPVRLNAEFHPGDSVRLRLVPNEGGYLYLFQRDAESGWRLASSQRVMRGESCVLPGTGVFESDQPGRKQFLVVLSPREEPSLGSLETSALDALAASGSADVVKATVSGGESAYVVDTRAQLEQQRVVFEVTLEFR